MGSRGGTQVVGGFQATQPCQLVGFVQFLARSASHVDVQRLRLVDPLLAARRGFHQPARRHFKGGSVDIAQVLRDAVDLHQRAVEVFQVRDHDFIPQVACLQVTYQVAIDFGEFARQVRFHVQVLERRLDTGRYADDVRDRCRRRNRHAVRVAHAEFGDALTHRGPVHGRRGIDFQVAAALFCQQFDRILRQDATVPQRTGVGFVTAALFSQLGRRQVGVVAHRFHRGIGKRHGVIRSERDAHHVQAILEAHDAHADRTVAHIRIARFIDCVVIDVDHVVQHAHRGAHGLGQLDVIELAFFHVRWHVHGTEVADGDFIAAGVQGDFRAQVRAVNNANVRLRAADVARILEGDPWMAGFKQHRQHLAPQVQRSNLLERTDFAGGSLGFVAQVSRFKGLSDFIVQVWRFARREQGPVAFFHHALHEHVRNPVGRVHVVGAAAVIARVLAQVEEFLDVHVPGFQVGADGALAFTALVDGHGRVIDYFQERHDALRLAVGALDVGAQGAHWRPVIAQAAGVLGQQRVILDRVVDAFQVIGDGAQVARRQLRAQGARVEQGRRRAHEVERGQQAVELDGTRFAVGFIQCQAHRHAQIEGLWHFDAHVVDVHEVAVIQGLQADVAELQVAVRHDSFGQALQVEAGEYRVQQLGSDTLGDVGWEIGQVFSSSGRLRHVLAEYFLAHRVQQDAGRDLAVGRVFFHQRARCQDGRLVQFFDWHAVVQVFHRFSQDGVGIDVLFQAGAGGVDQVAHFLHVQQTAHAVVRDIQLWGSYLCGTALRFLLQAALFHVLGTVQDVGTRHVVFARTHQRQFHLILHVFNMEGTATWVTAHQRAHHGSGQLLDQFTDARRGRALAAVDGQKRLGHRNRDLRRLKCHHRTVAANDAIVAQGRARTRNAMCRVWRWRYWRWMDGNILR